MSCYYENLSRMLESWNVVSPKKKSDDYEDLQRFFKSCTVNSGSGNNDFVYLNDDLIHVAVVHDSSGYTPLACFSISSLNGHVALEDAYELLEEVLRSELSEEELKEAYEVEEKEGYDPITEGIDGRSFQVTGNELYEIVQSFRNSDKSIFHPSNNRFNRLNNAINFCEEED